MLVNRRWSDEHFFNADGEMLIVPQQGALRFVTEFGVIEVEPGEICVIPRGVIFKVELIDGPARGYVCENYGAKFTLPDRGPIGANCLANPRDFKTPVACLRGQGDAVPADVKWAASSTAPRSTIRRSTWSPGTATTRPTSTICDLLAGRRDPVRPSRPVDLHRADRAVGRDEGTANIDFVIFPPRWMVAENTFRPPWYHRNIMSEFMGLIYGVYDAKPEGFVPGGMSLHNMMLPHGPDADAFEQASNAELKPVKLENTMAFMFETRFPQHVTRYAAGLLPFHEHRACRRCRAPTSGPTARPTSTTWSWCARRAAPRCRRASGPIR
jgi:homogentisate 1,2-dioxygenase